MRPDTNETRIHPRCSVVASSTRHARPAREMRGVTPPLAPLTQVRRAALVALGDEEEGEAGSGEGEHCADGPLKTPQSLPEGLVSL